MNDKQKRLNFYKFLDWLIIFTVTVCFLLIFGSAVVWLMGWV